MRKIIKTGELDWQQREVLAQLLNVSKLPYLVILEGVDDE